MNCSRRVALNAMPADRESVVTQLKALLGDRLSTSQSVRDQHGTDIAHPAAQPPDAVAYPLTTEEVAAIVRHCHAARMPVIAFGVGSSLEGHVLAPHGGICIDLGRMDQVVAM